MASVKDTASFFAQGNTKQFEFCLKLYPQVLKIKAEKRSKKPEELIRLDEWYQNELPKRIKERGKDAHMVHEELVQTMKWKQSRGKFYPQLSYLVKVNTPRAVMLETKKAFRKLPNLEQAITALSNLKGVGTTMASALLAAAAPDKAPFMADECLMAIPEIEGIDYTTKEYLNFVNHIQTTVQRLNAEKDKAEEWSAHSVELALWTHYVASDLQPELLEDLPTGLAIGGGVPNGLGSAEAQTETEVTTISDDNGEIIDDDDDDDDDDDCVEVPTAQQDAVVEKLALPVEPTVKPAAEAFPLIDKDVVNRSISSDIVQIDDDDDAEEDDDDDMDDEDDDEDEDDAAENGEEVDAITINSAESINITEHSVASKEIADLIGKNTNETKDVQSTTATEENLLDASTKLKQTNDIEVDRTTIITATNTIAKTTTNNANVLEKNTKDGEEGLDSNLKTTTTSTNHSLTSQPTSGTATTAVNLQEISAANSEADLVQSNGNNGNGSLDSLDESSTRSGDGDTSSSLEKPITPIVANDETNDDSDSYSSAAKRSLDCESSEDQNSQPEIKKPKKSEEN